jgi:hypothetical protein
VFEDFYEITRRGDVFSRRHGRFIKHNFGLNRGTYIESTTSGAKYHHSIQETVKASFAPSLAHF